MNKKIAFIGAGNMAEAFCTGMIKAGVTSAKDICLCDIRSITQLTWARARGIKKFTSSAAEAVKWAQIVILSVKPKDLLAVLDEINKGVAGSKRSKKLFISIAAGKKLATLESQLGSGVPVIRVMPNTPCLVRKGMSAYCRGRWANKSQGALARNILAATGEVIEVKEGLMDAVTAVSGSGPAYVFLFMEALQAAGIKVGLSQEASFKLAAQTIRGAAEMILCSDGAPALLRKKVTSPGGTTERAILVFEKGGLRKLVEKAVFAARDRSIEMGRAS